MDVITPATPTLFMRRELSFEAAWECPVDPILQAWNQISSGHTNKKYHNRFTWRPCSIASH